MDGPRTCFIGGERFSRARVKEYVEGLEPKTQIVTGSATGAETYVIQLARARKLRVTIPSLLDLDDERALKMQVIDVYVHALRGGTLVLVGAGPRVDEARDMLSRSNAWPMEITEL